MKKKNRKSSGLIFEKDYKVLSSKKGGYIVIYLTNGHAISLNAVKLLRQVSISLAIKDRNEKIEQEEVA